MFDKSNIPVAALSCRAGSGSFRRCLFPLFMAALAVMVLTGCSTYYGYDDTKEGFRDPMPDGAPRDVRHYAVVTTENGDASLKCFRLLVLEKNAMTGTWIVGREERYRRYDPRWYLENPPYNAGWTYDSFWLFSECYFFWSDDKFVDGNPFIYVVPAIGQIFLAWDLGALITASLVDSCLFIGRCCWTGVSSSCAWVGGRLFGWMGNWYLADHKPGPLRMLSYMPFINFFVIQTPPYMTTGPSYSDAVRVRFDPSDYKVVKRTHAVTLIPAQELCNQYKVEARVFCNGKLCGSREFRTDSNGDVALTGFLRECVKTAPLTARDFSLEFKLSDSSGSELLSRKVHFTAEQVMSTAAASDLAAYRSSDTDYLNKLLLSRRSHLEWRQEIFSGELAIPAIK